MLLDWPLLEFEVDDADEMHVDDESEDEDDEADTEEIRRLKVCDPKFLDIDFG